MSFVVLLLLIIYVLSTIGYFFVLRQKVVDGDFKDEYSYCLIIGTILWGVVPVGNAIIAIFWIEEGAFDYKTTPEDVIKKILFVKDNKKNKKI